eukprot:4096955-Heterocapsa_arctica.AAC.1
MHGAHSASQGFILGVTERLQSPLSSPEGAPVLGVDHGGSFWVVEESYAPFDRSEVVREHAARIFYDGVYGNVAYFLQYPTYQREDEEIGGVGATESNFAIPFASSGELLARGLP